MRAAGLEEVETKLPATLEMRMMMQGVRGKARGSGQQARERNGQRKRGHAKQRPREAGGTPAGRAREVEPPDAGPQHPEPREAAATRTRAQADVSAAWSVVAFRVRGIVRGSWGGVPRKWP